MPYEARRSTLSGSGVHALELEVAPESGPVLNARRVLKLRRAGDLIENRYRILSAAATGGMGSVYACDDTLLNRPVAVKFVRTDANPEGRLEERFFGEARITAQLQSPHVARLYDYGIASTGEAYIVVEYVDGPDLFSVLHVEGPRSPEEVVSYALQICEGLREAHRKGIIHCDVKPENLVRTRTPEGDPVVKIVDFGISRAKGNLCTLPIVHAGRLSGSPNYMSPEQIENPDRVDERTDIWALGVVMFELLTGRLPFFGSDDRETCAAVLNAPAPTVSSLLAGVLPELEEAILRCLKKDPSERFSDVEELALALTLVAAHQFVDYEPRVEVAAVPPPSAGGPPAAADRPSGVGIRTSRWARGRRALSVLAVAVTPLLCARSDQSGGGKGVRAERPQYLAHEAASAADCLDRRFGCLRSLVS